MVPEISCESCSGQGTCEMCRDRANSGKTKLFNVLCIACFGTARCQTCGGTGEIAGPVSTARAWQQSVVQDGLF